jgi:hypothetical protein
MMFAISDVSKETTSVADVTSSTPSLWPITSSNGVDSDPNLAQHSYSISTNTTVLDLQEKIHNKSGRYTVLRYWPTDYCVTGSFVPIVVLEYYTGNRD